MAESDIEIFFTVEVKLENVSDLNMFKFYNLPTGDESVYKLVQADQKNELESMPASRRRYRSIHSAMVRKECAESKSSSSKTMGVPQVRIDDPASFLKKNSKRPIACRPASVPPRLSQNKECQAGESISIDDQPKDQGNVSTKTDGKVQPKTCSRACTTAKKPPIPHGTLKLVIQPEKDFVKLNAMKIMELRPKETAPRYVDTNRGSTREWLNSGLASQYIHRKNYAHVPKYVVKRKNELIAQHKPKDESEKEPPLVRELDSQERIAMINGLKKNWDDVFTLYQSMPLLIDTPGKIKRKSKLEVQLKLIEKDIQVLQRHENIFVADVDRYIVIPPKV